MTLTLRIRNVDRLDNGMPTELVLNRRGAVIGRSPTCDWSLPDQRNFISSRHCEVRYEDGAYLLADLSTNGTHLNGSPDRMADRRRIAQGDVFSIGQYEVEARLSGEAASAAEAEVRQAAGGDAPPAWGGWESHGGAPPPPPPPPAREGWESAPGDGWDAPPAAGAGWAPPAAAPSSGWDAPAAPPSSGWDAPAAPPSSGWAAPAAPPSSGWDAPPAAAPSSNWAPPAAPAARGVSGSWEPPASAIAPAPVSSPWAQAAPASQPASDWSSAAPDHAPAPTPNDVWGQIAEGHVVDWARGGFDGARRDPFAARAAAPPPEAPAFAGSTGGVAGWAPPALPQVAQPAPERPAPPPAPPPTPEPRAAAVSPDALIAAAGLEPGQVRGAPDAVMARAGALLNQLVAGLVVMVEARARAKSQMGAEATSFSFDGNNPLKFARTPEQAIVQLLNEPERGFMDAGKAVRDAYQDLQSHQIATLKAMQGALRATLDRFSPAAIRSRAETSGILARLPGVREAALWQAYEREFGGVARDSDEAFMHVFAQEFRRAYEEASRNGR